MNGVKNVKVITLKKKRLQIRTRVFDFAVWGIVRQRISERMVLFTSNLIQASYHGDLAELKESHRCDTENSDFRLNFTKPLIPL